MRKKIFNLTILLVLTLTISGCQKSFDNITKTTDENLFEIKEVLYGKDTDGSLSISPDDEIYSMAEGAKKTGLTIDFMLTDVDNNIVEKTEPVHMDVTIKNESDVTYQLQQFMVEGNNYIAKNSFNTVVSNVEGLAFSTEDNAITFEDDTYRLKLKPGEEFKIGFDYSYKKTNDLPDEFLNLSFFALGSNSEVWYIELDQSQIKFV